jgi:hypothetical protein
MTGGFLFIFPLAGIGTRFLIPKYIGTMKISVAAS